MSEIRKYIRKKKIKQLVPIICGMLKTKIARNGVEKRFEDADTVGKVLSIPFDAKGESFEVVNPFTRACERCSRDATGNLCV